MLNDIRLYTQFVQQLAGHCFQPMASLRSHSARLEGKMVTVDTPGESLQLIERIVVDFYDNGTIRYAVYSLLPRDEKYKHLIAQQHIERNELEGINWGTRKELEKLKEAWVRQFGAQIPVEKPKPADVTTVEYLLFGRIAHALTLSGFTPVGGLLGSVAFERTIDKMNDGHKDIRMREVVGIEFSDQGRITGGSIQLLPTDDSERGRFVHELLTRSSVEKVDVIGWQMLLRELWKTRCVSGSKP